MRDMNRVHDISDLDKTDEAYHHSIGTRPGQAASGADYRKTVQAGKHWKPLNLKNGWTNAAGGKRLGEYTVDGLGFVHIRGRISPGTLASGTVLADNVPAPALNELFSVAMGTTGGTISISVTTNGELALAGTASADVSFAGMTYQAP